MDEGVGDAAFMDTAATRARALAGPAWSVSEAGTYCLPSMVPLAVSTVIQIAYVVGLVVLLFLGPVTVAEMKGHDFLVGFGWLTMGVTYWIGAFKLARPESWWARHLYGPRKMARAEDRYKENPFT